MLASPCALASEVISACVRSSGFSRTHDAQRLNLKMRLLPDRTALKRLEHLLGESSEQLRTSGSYSRPGSAGSGIVEASSKAQTRTPPRPWREPPFLLWRWHALACKGAVPGSRRRLVTCGAMWSCALSRACRPGPRHQRIASKSRCSSWEGHTGSADSVLSVKASTSAGSLGRSPSKATQSENTMGRPGKGACRVAENQRPSLKSECEGMSSDAERHTALRSFCGAALGR